MTLSRFILKTTVVLTLTLLPTLLLSLGSPASAGIFHKHKARARVGASACSGASMTSVQAASYTYQATYATQAPTPQAPTPQPSSLPVPVPPRKGAVPAVMPAVVPPPSPQSAAPTQQAPTVQVTQVQATYYGDSYGFTAWLNGVRARSGLRPVSHDPSLSAWAAANNGQQIARGMGHHVMGAARRQNAGMGPGSIVWATWMASGAHQAALLDPTITRIGISANGSYWTFNGY